MYYIFNNDIAVSSTEKWIADSREKWIKLSFANALHFQFDWLFAVRVTLSGARAPELIPNPVLSENVNIELCEPADPDLN